MKAIASATLLLCAYAVVSATDRIYSVDKIPQELKEAAKAVVRTYEEDIHLYENGRVERSVIFAITILDEEGEQFALFQGPYDRNVRLSHLKGKIFNASGELEKVIKRDEIPDFSMIPAYSLYEDSRIKIIKPEFHSYPYTIEYTYNYEQNSTFLLPSWCPYPAWNISIQNARLQILEDREGLFRYKIINHAGDFEKILKEEREVLRLDMNHLPALVQESVSETLIDLCPRVLFGPTQFEFGGYLGSMNTWEELGSWIYQIGSERRSLDSQEVTIIRELVKDLDKEEEKVRRLYSYMQGKVRYVNISLGIGGFQTVPASQVSEVGYGDCKALSNYMCALLAAVGIDSRYTLVNAGREHSSFIEEFPSQQFNHVILAVPLTYDTIWLECTSQRFPAGYLGDFTDDREVLFVSEAGGKLGHTPRYSTTDNLKEQKVKCTLDEEMGATVCIDKKYHGIFFGEKQTSVLSGDRKDQKVRILQELPFSGFELQDFNQDFNLGKKPLVHESLSVRMDRLTSIEGEYISLPIGVFSEKLELPEHSRNRQYPVYIKRGYTLKDSVLFELPETMDILHLPDPVIINSDFGNYCMKVIKNNQGISCTRELSLFSGEWDSVKFEEYFRFLRKVRLADHTKVLLVRR